VTVYDLYGFRGDSIDSFHVNVEMLLGIRMVARDSSFSGEYYSFEYPDGEEITILANDISYLSPDENEEDFHEPNYADYPIILRVESTNRGDELKKMILQISGVDFLRRTERSP
jgi:hypothetical protein